MQDGNNNQQQMHNQGHNQHLTQEMQEQQMMQQQMEAHQAGLPEGQMFTEEQIQELWAQIESGQADHVSPELLQTLKNHLAMQPQSQEQMEMQPSQQQLHEQLQYEQLQKLEQLNFDQLDENQQLQILHAMQQAEGDPNHAFLQELHQQLQQENQVNHVQMLLNQQLQENGQFPEANANMLNANYQLEMNQEANYPHEMLTRQQIREIQEGQFEGEMNQFNLTQQQLQEQAQFQNMTDQEKEILQTLIQQQYPQMQEFIQTEGQLMEFQEQPNYMLNGLSQLQHQEFNPPATNSMSMDHEQQLENERRSDEYFEQQLRIFYKNMCERLPNATIDKISRRAKQLCEQINKVQGDIIQAKRRNKALQREQGKSQEQSDEDNRVPGEEHDASDSFCSALYGPNSTIKPDTLIQDVMGCLNSHPDLMQQFKRFIPEEDEEEMQVTTNHIKHIRKVFKVEASVDFDGDIDFSADNTNLVSTKRETYQQLIRSLEEYKELAEKNALLTAQAEKLQKNKVKQKEVEGLKKQSDEALQNIGEKIMAICKLYQKYVTDDYLKSQNLADKDNLNELDKERQMEQIEKDMTILFSIIPKEITSSFKLNHLNSIKADASLKPIGKRANKYASRGRKADTDQSQEDETEEEEGTEEEESGDEQGSQESGEEEDELVASSRGPVSDDEDYPEQKMPEGLARVKVVSNEFCGNPRFADFNKYELKTFEKLHRLIGTESEWQDFIKLLMLYMEGVISIHDMFNLFDYKFGSRLKADMINEISALLPTRDHNRRLGSDILRPWNDLENQQFHKIYGSSYFKLNPSFPLPICSEKLNPRNDGFYKQFLNEKYLSLSMGSENFKFKMRNANEDLIFRNEDDMYRLDTQIEMFQRCLKIIQEEIEKYDELIEKGGKEKQKYTFPRHRLKPLMYYWEKKYKELLLPLLHIKPFQRDTLLLLSIGIQDKLKDLQNYKKDQQPVFDEVFRKNFIKSLDHRSYQYKEFMRKYHQKTAQLQEIKDAASNPKEVAKKSLNQLKGGNFKSSKFYHSLGNFVEGEYSRFDSEVADFPIDMSYSSEVLLENKQKLPHQRLVFKDDEALKLAVKMLCLHIRHYNQHNNNDRPRLTTVLSNIIHGFMKLEGFHKLNQQCAQGQVECLLPQQIDLVMAQDSTKYYRERMTKFNAGPDELQDNLSRITVQIQLPKDRNTNVKDAEERHTSPQKPAGESLALSQATKQEQTPVKVSSPTKSEEMFTTPVRPARHHQFKKMCIEDISDAKKALFLPHFRPEQYQLFYTTSPIFIFIKLFYSIYERLLKSKDLVLSKIHQDLSEMTSQEKEELGLITKDGEINQEVLDTLHTERLECLLKGIFAVSTNQPANGVLMPSQGGISSFGSQLLLDANKYEDFARSILGKNAFLLFHIDKLINMATKQLHAVHPDNVCQKSFKVFNTLNDSRSNGENINDSQYLAIYMEQVVDQFSLFENFVNFKNKKGQNKNCAHSGAKFFREVLGMDSEQNDQDGESDQINSSSNVAVNAQQANQQSQNFNTFRFLWSPQSKILSIHYLNLNPFQISTQGHRNYRQTFTENFKQVYQQTMDPIPTTSESNPEVDCPCQVNKVGDSQQPPIFLKRNLKIMQKARDKEKMHEVSRNGITVRVLPQAGGLCFEPGSSHEDIYEYRVRKTKLNLPEKRKLFVKQDLENQIKQNELVQNKFMKLSHQ